MTYVPYQILGQERPSRWLVTCDHAANTVPGFVGDGSLGLSQSEMSRHIAYDPGAAGVTAALGEVLDAPAILSNFSRLVIDPNRGEDDPTLLMKLYDGTIIPGNRHAGPAELEARLEACYRPYHAALGQLVAARADRVYLSIHSFTPQLKGRPPRPWQIGVLYAADERLSAPLIARLAQEPDLCVGANEPYGGHLPGDAVDRHAIAHGLPNVLIELRNDLIATPEQQRAWAERLAPILEEVLAETGL
ncbi:Predicted N-formylglutamate amidohydrolase [Pseudooceanicola antarcticus]|uniref:N-formylglutamate amidohydrolase n=1 Tax=Pseudooceanicola antarcticus TaxID=1247613 RepID=A0A285HZL3_9RHOB|nr:N-formylglutamate amidohydrolase [Pseudooceanicola antarcticus]PJE30310.1 N-formylglutamate amidohydrolase [Pseudooceanicola antarcticus]SNY41160.1 Predicted N-formylglutamate amidohydrolase [Pseudooceanicola antarcticus]